MKKVVLTTTISTTIATMNHLVLIYPMTATSENKGMTHPATKKMIAPETNPPTAKQ